jgi:hypothetical protein
VICIESGSYRATTLVVERDRPPVHRLEGLDPTASFPSGHIAATVALYGGLLLLLASWVGRRWFSALRNRSHDRPGAFRRMGADVPQDASPDRQRCGRDHGPPRTPASRCSRRARRPPRRTRRTAGRELVRTSPLSPTPAGRSAAARGACAASCGAQMSRSVLVRCRRASTRPSASSVRWAKAQSSCSCGAATGWCSGAST